MPVFLIVAAALAGDAAAGKVLYAANCTACHGVAGDGKGPAAIALKPKPGDFTVAAYWVEKTDVGLAGVIKGGKPGTPMTAFTQFSDTDVANLVTYLRSFAPPAP